MKGEPPGVRHVDQDAVQAGDDRLRGALDQVIQKPERMGGDPEGRQEDRLLGVAAEERRQEIHPQIPAPDLERGARLAAVERRDG